ncbi:hypothetical protein B4N89_27705 [Embleya scabrispora]|uniref:Uncharacterized protein n=1 Tax=Embleya scabrispora TaxID=159449 RepID=A0A1T3P5Q6_9ACTN|nr:hypothetical protein [Embleya scabrispora]OPC84210.1 hypothetical protein B4N89_27705 [Embleya scabrispora]
MINDIEWGDAPTWIGAIGASLAAWAAFWTLRSQRRQIAAQQQFIQDQSEVLALQRSALIEDAEDRRSAQALRISVACRIVDDAWIVQVTNASSEPITDLDARFGESYVVSDAVVFPPDGGTAVRSGSPVAVLGPGRKALLESSRLSTATLENSRPTVTFTDRAGRQWRTDEHDNLQPVVQPGQ